MPSINNQPEKILIAGITPYFLERGVLWFEEHYDEIEKQARHDPWWRNHTIFVEPNQEIPFSPFVRNLTDLGYVKVPRLEHRGEFAVRGGIIDVFPVNRESPIRVEFSGNAVERILIVPLKAEALAVPKIKDPSGYERLWLSQLKPGDYMVHVDHGIGIFQGIVSEMHGGNEEEFYALEYAAPRQGAKPDRLLIPRTQSIKLSRYIGFETPTIHRLGGTVWENTKRRARLDAQKLAEELLELYRMRSRAKRALYPRYADIEADLEASFPYEETPDQSRSLEDIHTDLSSEKPMDRLLLGDVGFGKTELAIRTSARVAFSGKQVAVLSPTTILADQHYTTFQERLRGLPLKIILLSRLTPKLKIHEALAEIKNGTVDIVIGTHRLLASDVEWANLGLAIIDEEQRFGVKQKETFKRLRSEIDILSLSATPIPRTLSLALSQFRDISLLQTPPLNRQPVQTFVLPFSKKIVREALAFEKKRKGQVFYLWNRIETIDAVRRELGDIAKGATIEILHGRMREPELIRVMHEFRAGAIDILVATTIIENGLDLPSVNTLIVANAARLGLAQAYQLRGRVGRGDENAYAYFLYPRRAITDKGKLRLKALKEAEGLGGGFQIALKDLEIRGAGNILGRQQSGTMNRVGLNLYAQLLNEALEELGLE